MAKQIPGKRVAFTVASTVPSSGDGIDLVASFPEHAMRPQLWAIDVTVTVADSNVELWGRIAETDTWAKINGKRGVFVDGKLGGVIVAASGTQLFIVEDIGTVVDRLALRKLNAAATVAAGLIPIYESTRGS